MDSAETKIEYIQRAKASLRAELRAKSWVEKVRSIERMRAAAKKAREGMARTQAERSA